MALILLNILHFLVRVITIESKKKVQQKKWKAIEAIILHCHNRRNLFDKSQVHGSLSICVIKKSLKLKSGDVRRSTRRKINAGVSVHNLDASRQDLSLVNRGEGDDKLQKHHT